jgi:hypothetical protein
MNYDAITLEDCLILNEAKNKEVVINDGKITEIIDGGYKNGK